LTKYLPPVFFAVTAPRDSGYLIPAERIDSAILELRGERVMLDVDLAEVHGVTPVSGF
jgi:hypothetical protein